MAGQRNPKRQRKKEAQAARRAALLAELERRRKRRRTAILGAISALVLGGAAIAAGVTLSRGPEPSPAARATPPLAPSPAPIACEAQLPAAAGTTKPAFGAAEDQKLDKKKTYVLRLDTSCGRIDVKLALDRAPKTVNSVVFLTRKGFYDGLTFHRLVSGFVIQGGDPAGDGSGGPGYKVTEPPPKGIKYTKGIVALAKAGNESAGTSGSQFFIVVGPAAETLPAEYALLGDVVAGIEVAEKIVTFAGQGESPPAAKVFIEKATIVEQ